MSKTNYNIIKLKSNSGNFYVLDAISNNIYKIDNETDWNSICMEDIGNKSDVRLNALEELDIKSNVEKNAKTLVLEITEQCNLRCDYCVFDEKTSVERNHSENPMTLEVAIDAINKFYKRTNKEEGYIVFYGGEPLLEFNKIKEIVAYVNKLTNYKFKFSFTTNGTALLESKFQFLIENDFLITVSLDGDKETHDKNRKTISGKGTFDTIIKNLEKLKKFNSHYFETRILINSVIGDATKIDVINEFFSGNLINRDSLRFSSAMQDSNHIDDVIESRISLESVKKLLENKKYVENHYVDTFLKKIEFRKLDSEARSGKKICIPFSNRTYVRTNGKIQFCERIEKFGIINDDVELQVKSDEIYNDFIKQKQDACSKCFAYNFCELCPASFIKESRLDVQASESICNRYRNNFLKALHVYINDKELNIL